MAQLFAHLGQQLALAYGAGVPGGQTHHKGGLIHLRAAETTNNRQQIAHLAVTQQDGFDFAAFLVGVVDRRANRGFDIHQKAAFVFFRQKF